MKKCEEKWKFRRVIIGTKSKLKLTFPSPANGNALTNSIRENIKELRLQKLNQEEEYRNHIDNCFVCNS